MSSQLFFSELKISYRQMKYTEICICMAQSSFFVSVVLGTARSEKFLQLSLDVSDWNDTSELYEHTPKRKSMMRERQAAQCLSIQIEKLVATQSRDGSGAKIIPLKYLGGSPGKGGTTCPEQDLWMEFARIQTWAKPAREV